MFGKGLIALISSIDNITAANIGFISECVCLCGRGFGSCHSFGCAEVLCGYGMCQMRGASRSTIFLKMRRVGCILSSSVPNFSFKSGCHEVVPLSTWEFFVISRQPFCLKTNLS
jgi:hypothetical protein